MGIPQPLNTQNLETHKDLRIRLWQIQWGFRSLYQCQRERPGAFRIAMLVDLDTMAILALGELPQ